MKTENLCSSNTLRAKYTQVKVNNMRHYVLGLFHINDSELSRDLWNVYVCH